MFKSDFLIHNTTLKNMEEIFTPDELEDFEKFKNGEIIADYGSDPDSDNKGFSVCYFRGRGFLRSTFAAMWSGEEDGFIDDTTKINKLYITALMNRGDYAGLQYINLEEKYEYIKNKCGKDYYIQLESEAFYFEADKIMNKDTKEETTIDCFIWALLHECIDNISDEDFIKLKS